MNTTDYTTSVTGASTTAPSADYILFLTIFVIVAYVINSILLGRIFKKAGVSPAIAWVPIYNNWKTLQLGGQKGYWAALALIPIVQYVSIVFMFIAYYNIGLKLGKTGTFVLWAIFLPIVWIIWLATDKSTYNNALGAPSQAPEHNGAGPTATPPVAPTATPIV